MNTWSLLGDGAAGADAAVENDGVPVGSRSTHNYLPGTGITTMLADTGTEITIQHAVNTAVMETRSNAQAGSSRYCSSSSVTDQYTCNLTPTLTAYSAGMVVTFKSITDNTGAATLNIDALGPKPVKVIANGVKADPSDSDIDADSIYELSYDGIDFLVVAGLEPGDHATATPVADGVPMAESDGNLNAGWIGQDQDYSWTGIQDFSGARLQAPNGLLPPAADCDSDAEDGRLYIDTDAASGQQLYVCEGAANGWVLQGDGTGGAVFAPVNHTYLSLDADATLSDERVISPQGVIQSKDNGANGDYELYYAVSSIHSQSWDDFLPGQNASPGVGTLGWWTVGGDVGQLDAEADHPGIVGLTTATTANATHYLHLGGSDGTYGAYAGLDTASNWEMIYVFRTASSIAETKYTIGLVDDAAGDPAASGLWVRYWDSLGCTTNGTDGTWIYESCSGTVCSTQAGPPIAAATWYALRIRNDGAAGTIKFSMRTDGGSWSTEASLATNIPPTAVSPVFKTMQCGTVSRSLEVDAFGHTMRSVQR